MLAKTMFPFVLPRGGVDVDPRRNIRQEFDRLFDDMAFGWIAPQALGVDLHAPHVDVVETDAGLELKADLPGVDPKDIAVDLADGILTLKAERRQEKTKADEKEHRRLTERAFGVYLRRFALPFRVEPDQVAARFDNGVLTVTAPRAAPLAPPTVKIPIQTAPERIQAA